MLYEHRTETCLAARIGEGGLDDAEFEAALGETAAALGDLRASHADGSLPFLRLAHARDDLARLGDVAGRMRGRFADIVVLGTGGSSLGGRTLAALAPVGPDSAGGPRLHFVDNIDPHAVAALLANLDLANTGLLVISKSGGTAETLAQAFVFIDALRGVVGEDSVAAHVTTIVQPGDSALRGFAAARGMEILDHDPGIGGRYSVLSLVGLLPALIAGLDAGAVRDGAAEVLDATLAAKTPRDAAPAVGAALSIGLARARGATSTVLMPYVERLDAFALWYRQLWAESLGKGGRGTTPIKALGVVDQHSQLQLWLDGPRDKMFTLVTLDVAGAGPRVPADLSHVPDLAWLRGRTIGDLMDAEARATADALARNRRPVRLIRLARLDEAVLGALLMHFMIETVIAAHVLGVDPFDQPAVEEGKRLARAYLAGEDGS